MSEDFCFGRRYRLRKRSQFLSLYQNAEKVYTPFFVLYIRENELPNSRVGITVSKKIGKTVLRNRLKRRLREIFRLNRGLIHPPSDVVVNAKRSAALARHDQLRKCFMEGIDRWRRQRENE